MPPKVATPKHGKLKIKKRAPQVWTLADYEEEIANVNRQLAYFRANTQKAYEDNLAFKAEIKQLRRDYKDIKKSIQREIAEEEDETAELCCIISELMREKDEQEEWHENIMRENHKKAEEEQNEQKELIEELTTTLSIVNHFEIERRSYEEREEELKRREMEQKSAQEIELYELDKKIRIEKDALNRQKREQLDQLLQPLLKEANEDEIAEQETITRHQNIALYKKINLKRIAHARIKEKYDDALKKKRLARLDLCLAKERLILVRVVRTRNKVLQHKDKITEKGEDNLEESIGTQISDTEAKGRGSARTKLLVECPCFKLHCLFEQFEHTAKLALTFTDWESKPRDSQLSVSEDQKQAEINEDFAYFDRFIRDIAETIDTELAINWTSVYDKKVTEILGEDTDQIDAELNIPDSLINKNDAVTREILGEIDTKITDLHIPYNTLHGTKTATGKFSGEMARTVDTESNIDKQETDEFIPLPRTTEIIPTRHIKLQRNELYRNLQTARAQVRIPMRREKLHMNQLLRYWKIPLPKPKKPALTRHEELRKLYPACYMPVPRIKPLLAEYCDGLK